MSVFMRNSIRSVPAYPANAAIFMSVEKIGAMIPPIIPDMINDEIKYDGFIVLPFPTALKMPYSVLTKPPRIPTKMYW